MCGAFFRSFPFWFRSCFLLGAVLSFSPSFSLSSDIDTLITYTLSLPLYESSLSLLLLLPPLRLDTPISLSSLAVLNSVRRSFLLSYPFTLFHDPLYSYDSDPAVFSHLSMRHLPHSASFCKLTRFSSTRRRRVGSQFSLNADEGPDVFHGSSLLSSSSSFLMTAKGNSLSRLPIQNRETERKGNATLLPSLSLSSGRPRSFPK